MSSGNASVEIGQFAELAGAIIRSLPRWIDPKKAQFWIEHPELLRYALYERLSHVTGDDQLGLFLEDHFIFHDVLVDYNQPIESLIQAGPYYEFHPDYLKTPCITSVVFPAQRQGQVNLPRIHLCRYPTRGTYHSVLEYLRERGLRPVDPYELLAFGKQYPGFVQPFKGIMALGQMWHCPDLNQDFIFDIGISDDGQRWCELDEVRDQNRPWPKDEWFAAVELEK